MSVCVGGVREETGPQLGRCAPVGMCEGEQAADKCATTSVCQSGCARGWAGRVLAVTKPPPGSRHWGRRGCRAARAGRGASSGLERSLESRLGWRGLAEPGWAGRAAELGHLPGAIGATVLNVPSPVQEALLDRWGQHQRGQHGWQQPHPPLHQPERACWYGPPRPSRYHPTVG